MKKVISVARKLALLYMKIKIKMWSPTVQCKVIATLVIITGTLDTSENIWLNPSLRHKVGKNPLIFKQVSAYSLKKKTFACGPALREPFVRGYLHGGRKISELELGRF